MATKKVFIDESGIEVDTSFAGEKLIILIREPEGLPQDGCRNIVFEEDDAFEFIQDLYRLKKAYEKNKGLEIRKEIENRLKDSPK
jgi:hypothetical protein